MFGGSCDEGLLCIHTEFGVSLAVEDLRYEPYDAGLLCIHTEFGGSLAVEDLRYELWVESSNSANQSKLMKL